MANCKFDPSIKLFDELTMAYNGIANLLIFYDLFYDFYVFANDFFSI